MDFSDSDGDSSFSSGASLPVVTEGVDDMDDALFGGLGSSKPLTQTTSASGACLVGRIYSYLLLQVEYLC